MDHLESVAVQVNHSSAIISSRGVTYSSSVVDATASLQGSVEESVNSRTGGCVEGNVRGSRLDTTSSQQPACSLAEKNSP